MNDAPMKCTRAVGMICRYCGAYADEDCPLDDMTPELLTAPPIGGITGVCEDDGVCESCQ